MFSLLTGFLLQNRIIDRVRVTHTVSLDKKRKRRSRNFPCGVSRCGKRSGRAIDLGNLRFSFYYLYICYYCLFHTDFIFLVSAHDGETFVFHSIIYIFVIIVCFIHLIFSFLGAWRWQPLLHAGKGDIQLARQMWVASRGAITPPLMKYLKNLINLSLKLITSLSMYE